MWAGMSTRKYKTGQSGKPDTDLSARFYVVFGYRVRSKNTGSGDPAGTGLERQFVPRRKVSARYVFGHL